MVNKPAVDWVKQQIKNGYQSEQILQNMVNNGYGQNEASEAVRLASKSKVPMALLVSVLFFVILGVIGFAFLDLPNIVSDTGTQESTDIQPPPDAEPDPEEIIEETYEEDTIEILYSLPVDFECAELPEMIVRCEEYTCSFNIPARGQTLNNEVIGKEDGHCLFEQGIPGDEILECSFPEDKLNDAGNLYSMMLNEMIGTELDPLPEDDEIEYYGSMIDSFCETNYDDGYMDVGDADGLEITGSGELVGDEPFADSEDGSKGIFYRVSGGESDMYLLGSIHYGREDMYPMHQKIGDSFGESDVLVLEIDFQSLSMEEMEYLSEMGMYDDPEIKMTDVITEDTFQRLLDVMEPLGATRETLERVKPWYAAMELVDIAFYGDGTGYMPEIGIDEFFISEAMDSGMETIGLETIESQMSTFDILSEESQEIYLSNALDEIEPDYEGFSADDMISFWREGDVDSATAVGEDFIEGAETDSLREFAEALTIERDSEMAEKLIEMLEDGEEDQYFAVVGYLHLVGEESIVENLRDSGYDVEIVY